MRASALVFSLSFAVTLAEASVLPVPYTRQSTPTTCAAAVFTMVANFAGSPLDLRALLRSVYVTRTGISWLDLAEAGRPLGLETLVVQLTEPELDGLLDSGQPVIVSVVEGRGKHAVVIVGREAGAYHVLDPARPHRTRLSAIELRQTWARSQAVIVHRASDAAALGVSLGTLRRQNHRFRAVEFSLRAQLAEASPRDALVLYGRAVAEDPTVAEVYLRRARLYARMGRHVEADNDRRQAERLTAQERKSAEVHPPGW